MPEPASTTIPQQTTAGAMLRWLLVGLIGMTLLSIIGAHAPPRIKLLGLFALVYGLTGGLFLGSLAQAFGVRRRGLVLIGAFLLIAAGQIGMTLEAYRLHRAAVIDATLRHAKHLPLNPTDPALPAPDAGRARRQAIAELLGARIGFPAYLAERVAALGRWPTPWPALFWSVEVLLGSAVGAWFARRCQSPSTPV